MRVARNIIAGAISGLGVVILLQQYAIAYPTGMITLLGVVVGIVVQFGLAQLVTPRPTAVAAVGMTEPTRSFVVSEASSGWRPTHRAPASGLDAWASTDGTVAPIARLDPRLEVSVEETVGEWARITCENGWSAWVDRRSLEVRS